MAQVHCERFPSCFEIGENNHTPKCKAEGCPGNRTWRDVIPDAFAPAATHGKPDGAVRQLEPWQFELDEVIGHLGAAIHQSVASDDQIIMDHVKAAHEIAKIVRRKA